VEPNYVWEADIELFGVWSAEVMQGEVYIRHTQGILPIDKHEV